MKLKLRRKTIIPLVLIVVTCLVLLPILSYLINKNIENFDSSSYPAKGKTDRILFSKYNYDRNYKDSLGRFTDMSGQYAYCLGGNIKCNGTAKLVPILDNYEYGTTYTNYCSDNTKPSCVNNYYSSLTDPSMVNHKNEVDSVFGVTGINVLDSLQYPGFVGPYRYTAFVRDIDSSYNKNITYYTTSDRKYASANKSICNLVAPMDKLSCENYYLDILNPIPKPITPPTTTTTGTTAKTTVNNDDDDYTENNESGGSCDAPIPCIANFGTEIGENLCCGQTGVLQNTKYVCPSTAPKCSNFKCGSKFGTCGV